MKASPFAPLFFPAFLGLVVASTGVLGAVGGDTVANDTNYTFSTKTITHDTVVTLPLANGATAQTFLSSLLGSYPTETRAGLSVDSTLADPVVQ